MSKCGKLMVACLLIAGQTWAEGPTPKQPRASLLGAMAAAHPELRAVAEADLARRIAALPKTDAVELPPGFPYGVHSVSELRSATIGFGFEVFTVPTSAIKQQQLLEHSLVSTGTWRFAVMVGDHPVALMTLAKMGGEFRVVEVGAAQLAGLLDAMAIRHSAQGAERLKFIRVPSAHLDLMEVTHPGSAPRYEALSGTSELLGSKEAMGLLRR